jgi:hypothetical protein
MGIMLLTDHSNRSEPAVYSLVRIGLILAVAAYGAVVVQNVTGMLKDIFHHPVIVQPADRPNR